MSVSNISSQTVGAYHRPNLSQVLSTLLNKVDDSTDQPSPAASALDPTNTSQDGGCGQNGTTGASTTQLSDGILNVLFQMQEQDTSADASTTATDASTDSTSMEARVSNFLKSMDTDGDGSVSQSEFEGYLTKNGATKDQADKIFASLDTDGSGAMSSDELTSAIQSGRPHGHHGGHHHGPPGGDLADELFSQIDSDDDGNISSTELENLVTANGGTADQSDQIFAALDPTNTGSVSKDTFEQTLEALLPPKPEQTSSATTAASGNPSSASPDGTNASSWLRLLDAMATAASAKSGTQNTASVSLAA